MNLQQLYYFKHLAEKEHLRQTADELFISSPALSATINRLEEELGAPLFDHIGRNIKLNEKGRLFYSRIVHILAELEYACSEVKPKTNSQAITIWTSTNVSWGDLFADYIYSHPDVVFSYRFVDISQVSAFPSDKQPDFIITPLSDLPIDHYEYEILIENDLPMLVVYDGHPLCGRTEVTLEEVAEEPFVMLYPTYSMRAYVDTLFGIIGHTPNIVAEGDAQLRNQLVRAGRGITITTEWASRSRLLAGLHFIPITSPTFPRTQAIAWPRGRLLSSADEEFLAYIKDYVKQ